MAQGKSEADQAAQVVTDELNRLAPQAAKQLYAAVPSDAVDRGPSGFEQVFLHAWSDPVARMNLAHQNPAAFTATFKRLGGVVADAALASGDVGGGAV